MVLNGYLLTLNLCKIEDLQDQYECYIVPNKMV
jgi:hypothetical protein